MSLNLHLIKVPYFPFNIFKKSLEISKLDGSIKKNTAFVKKLKSLSSEKKTSLLNEAENLKLEKYLQEMTTSLLEWRFKHSNDVFALIELLVHLRMRFPDFLNEYILALANQIGPPPVYSSSVSLEQKEKEENARLLKLKNAVRLILEFDLCGLNSQIQNHPTVLFVLKELVIFYTIFSHK